MTATQKRIAKQIARQLERIAAIADEHELLQSHGAITGALISSIGQDLEQQVASYEEAQRG